MCSLVLLLERNIGPKISLDVCKVNAKDKNKLGQKFWIQNIWWTRCIKKMNSDFISGFLVKDCGHLLAVLLRIICRVAFKTIFFPQLWKQNKVIPNLESGNINLIKRIQNNKMFKSNICHSTYQMSKSNTNRIKRKNTHWTQRTTNIRQWKVLGREYRYIYRLCNQKQTQNDPLTQTSPKPLEDIISSASKLSTCCREIDPNYTS